MAGGDFLFGLVADAQYCDCPDRGNRHYRASLGKFEEAVDTFNGLDLAFTVHMGDMIDRHEESFSRIVPIFEETRDPKFDVLGNHDYDYVGLTSGETVELLGVPAPYYQFESEGWRFVVLDTKDLSLYANPEGSEKHQQAEEILAELKESGAVNAKPYNGAVERRTARLVARSTRRCQAQRREGDRVRTHALVPEELSQHLERRRSDRDVRR